MLHDLPSITRADTEAHRRTDQGCSGKRSVLVDFGLLLPPSVLGIHTGLPLQLAGIAVVTGSPLQSQKSAPLSGIRARARSTDRHRRDLAMTTNEDIVQRFLNPDGGLREMPARRGPRLLVLKRIGRRIPVGPVLSEMAINDMLRPVSQDVAVLRHHLVDEGMLERWPPGIYRRNVGDIEGAVPAES